MGQWIRRQANNFYFLIITFVTGLFYFCFYSVGILLGLSMSFTLIGIPLLTHIMRTTHWFVRFERMQTKLYADISTEPRSRAAKTEGGLWAQAEAELRDRDNWTAVWWLMQKVVIGMACLVCAALLYFAPLWLIASPVISKYVPVYIGMFAVNGGWSSWIAVAAGAGLLPVCGWAGSGVVRWTGEYTRRMMRAMQKKGLPPS